MGRKERLLKGLELAVFALVFSFLVKEGAFSQ